MFLLLQYIEGAEYGLQFSRLLVEVHLLLEHMESTGLNKYIRYFVHFHD